MAAILLTLSSGCEGCGIGCSDTAGETAASEVDLVDPPPAAQDAGAPPPKYPPDAKACARIILVAHEGAQSAPGGVTRTKEEAREHAEALRRMVVDEGERFADVAQEASDSHAPLGGALGVHSHAEWPPMYAFIRDDVFDLEVGAVTPVLETERGYVIAWRCPLDAVHARHILVRYRGALAASPDVRRSKGQARKQAERLLKRVQSGDDVGELAREHSDDHQTAPQGGYVGKVTAGYFSPEFAEAALALELGQPSDVVESRFGFHVIQRVDPADGPPGEMP
jgi:hypothetical protein